MKALFVSPHPDDVEIGCGGTIARLTSEGHHVDIAVAVGQGDLHMVHSDTVITFTQRMEEQDQAASVLGVTEVHYLNIGPAARLDTIPLVCGIAMMDSLLSDANYDEVYIPLRSHAQDHNYVWDMMMAATRPSRNDRMSVYAYEQPTQYHGNQTTFDVQCRHYVTVSNAHWAKKLKALGCHLSQVGGREESVVSLEGVEYLGKLRGLEVCAGYAELYYPLRKVL